VRGILLNGPGEAIAIEELELDGPGPDEVVVRIEATGVCHSDLHIVENDGWGLRFPILLGHEGVGRIERVGEGVDEGRVGEYVVIGWRSPCGRCAPCLRGDPRRCRTPARAGRRLRRARDGEKVWQALLCGTFAERTVVHEAAAVAIPDALPPEQACLLGCAVATGVGAVRTTSPVWPGARVAVLGCGGVGLSAVQGARIAGAGAIVAVDVVPEKLDRARRLGATELVDARSGDVDAVEPVDFAFETAGRPETMALAVRLLAPGGTATMVGIPQPGSTLTLDLERDLWGKRSTIRVSYGGDHLPAVDFPELARLALAGELDLAALVTRTIRLDEVGAALDELARGAGLRSVVRFD
jgi:Zn-dependent alcohol dehydrogenase